MILEGDEIGSDVIDMKQTGPPESPEWEIKPLFSKPPKASSGKKTEDTDDDESPLVL